MYRTGTLSLVSRLRTALATARPLFLSFDSTGFLPVKRIDYGGFGITINSTPRTRYENSQRVLLLYTVRLNDKPPEQWKKHARRASRVGKGFWESCINAKIDHPFTQNSTQSTRIAY